MSIKAVSHARQEADADRLTLRLEREGLIVLPGRGFEIAAAERALIDQAHSDGRAKNISLGPGGVRGAAADPVLAGALEALMSRYRDFARDVIDQVAPRYRGALQMGRTSLRTRDVAQDSAPSPRRDDRRLHVDAFASQPTGGRRILRVFTNVDPEPHDRVWRVGEPFEQHACRFVEGARPLLPGEATLLRALSITRTRRTAYDQLMLQIHDRSKLDGAYQAGAEARELRFAPGTSWVVYTDSVVHAAIAGRCAFEQTLYLPADEMVAPEASPLRILERLAGRKLI
ncbi:MAG TPA: Kdo hydroxylase family protein [Caulobacteraceae bacterium]|jgi:hypothetical protein|nr:Kdo hydroxylase family protein [Caulobacteraceae bacterium]